VKNLIYAALCDIIFHKLFVGFGHKIMTQKPLILAVETSGRTGSVAIADGEHLLAEAAFSEPLRHSAELFPAVCGLLSRFNRRPDQIQHVYVSVGPGSFTGLRIAVTIAKTMHLANAAKIVAVYTSDCIAANAADYTQTQGKELKKIATILDAKRGQFFVAAYQNSDGRWIKTLPDCLMTPQEFVQKFADTKEPVRLLGEGLVYYKHLFRAPGIEFLDSSFWCPHAAKVHLLGYKMACEGQFADPLTLKPVYLRRPEAEEKWRNP
jgi:tRNA threonylcarbamoyladenosine biosynthesis protein TsaB